MNKYFAVYLVLSLSLPVFAGSDLPSMVGKTFDSFESFTNFYELVANGTKEGHALILTPVPHRVRINNSFFSTTNTQVFSINLAQVETRSLSYSKIITDLAKKTNNPGQFVEQGCWVAVLKNKQFESECFTDNQWNALQRSTLDNALTKLLTAVADKDLQEMIVIHNHPDKEEVLLQLGPDAKPKYFGPSAKDLKSVKEYTYVLEDRGKNVPLTGIVVPNNQSESVLFYYFRPLDLEDQNYGQYIPEAMKNGAMIDSILE